MIIFIHIFSSKMTKLALHCFYLQHILFMTIDNLSAQGQLILHLFEFLIFSTNSFNLGAQCLCLTLVGNSHISYLLS